MDLLQARASNDLSRSTSTPATRIQPFDGSSQQQEYQQEKRTLESLPSEITCLILAASSGLTSLKNLVWASPVFAQVYLARRPTILRRVILSGATHEPVLTTELVQCIRARNLQPECENPSLQLIKEFIDDYRVRRVMALDPSPKSHHQARGLVSFFSEHLSRTRAELPPCRSASTFTVVPVRDLALRTHPLHSLVGESLTDQDVADLSRLHFQLEFLLEDFCRHVNDRISRCAEVEHLDTVTTRPVVDHRTLRASERLRIKRALCRHEIYCHLFHRPFPWRTLAKGTQDLELDGLVDVASELDIADEEVGELYVSMFPAWELDELVGIYDFLINRWSMVYKDTTAPHATYEAHRHKSHFDGDAETCSIASWDSRPDISEEGVHVAQYKIGSINRGLDVLHYFLTTSDGLRTRRNILAKTLRWSTKSLADVLDSGCTRDHLEPLYCNGDDLIYDADTGANVGEYHEGRSKDYDAMALAEDGFPLPDGPVWNDADHVDGPNAAWLYTRSHIMPRSLDSCQYDDESELPRRRCAYVMWDVERLEEWGAYGTWIGSRPMENNRN